MNRRRNAALILATMALGAAPGAAHAEIVTFGSDLSAPADTVETHPVDTAFWASRLASGASAAAPESGQLLGVRIKGIALRNTDTPPSNPSVGGSTMFHIQVLEPQSDGGMKATQTSSDLFLPKSGDPQQINTFKSDFRQCVAKGDRVDFNTVGGYDPAAYPNGTPLRIFAAVPGSATAEYEKGGGTNNGQILRGRDTEGQELLMQVIVGRGPDGNQACPGGTEGAAGGGGGGGGSTSSPQFARVKSSRLTANSRDVATATLYCGTGSASRCRGTLTLTAKRDTGTVSLAKGDYTIPEGRNGTVRLRLNRDGRRLLKGRRGGLAVRLTAVTRPGGKARTSTKRLTLRRR
ncbi:MAG: hypothetical protein AVDCRST_MAG64-2606 [uncultured Phycisphaerae bacterium]|uniref:Uncharacterized protein n=1 Tax=uncultured Phycisphaerae bacterium TaxID=904963 RepID=A0A6J4PIC7_9BACT|nr:MAG: hypothetical protein AVDCRST_MAG64-2606 [uncultured Phycisphaerae bacterium]